MVEETVTREKTAPTNTLHKIEQPSSELYKVGMFTTASFAAVVGIWSIICLSSALISNEGPIALIKGLVGALLKPL